MLCHQPVAGVYTQLVLLTNVSTTPQCPMSAEKINLNQLLAKVTTKLKELGWKVDGKISLKHASGDLIRVTIGKFNRLLHGTRALFDDIINFARDIIFACPREKDVAEAMASPELMYAP